MRTHLAADAPHPTALLVIDMINTWEMDQGVRLRRAAHAILPTLRALIARARRAQVPVIYTNDNFGQWRSNLPALLELSRQTHEQSADIIDAIAPAATDYVVLKPEHSAFYATPLEPLLKALRTKHLVLTGVSGDQCVLATAGDALLRDYEVTIPRDAMACASAPRTRAILGHFRTVMEIKTPLARRVRWS